MQQVMTDVQQARYEEFKDFVAVHVEPSAAQWDREEQIPATVLGELGRRGYFGSCVPLDYDGSGWDMVTFGLLSEAHGRSCPALADVLTVQAMVSMTLLKWGTREQKTRWLPPLARGAAIGAFALTEPGAGSALHTLTSRFTRDPGGRLLLNGTKQWISCGQFADLFLVFGAVDGGAPVACLVSNDAPGVEIEPIGDLMGFRAAGLARVTFRDVEVAPADVMGKPGWALSHLAAYGLHIGRMSTACSALGLLRGCVEDSAAYASARRIGDGTVADLGMIRSLLARMSTDLEAASLLCRSACHAEDEHRPDAIERTLMAKYFSSRAAVQAASDAVQIRGASGCHGSSAVSRYYRDAKIMEIIEGTTQIHEELLGKALVDRVKAASTPLQPHVV